MKKQIQKIFKIRSDASLRGDNVKGPERITADELLRIIESREKVTLLDVRPPDEHDQWHIPGSILTSTSNLKYMEEHSYEGRIVLYCTAGVRSYIASKALSVRGIKGIADLVGGINAWVAAGGRVVSGK